jgi:tyrosyl-tRNA synthetase
MVSEKEANRQFEIIKQGVAEIFPEHELYEKIRKSLLTKKPLRIKQGIDPTSPDVHIGHMVPFRKMRQFQDLGHTGIIIIGDYTARIGDPTGRNRERPPLTEEKVKENALSYTDQIFTIVDKNRTEIHCQSSWFDDFDLQGVIKTISRFSLAQIMAHDTFRKRMEEGKRLSLHELLYPVLQAYDSVVIKADVEIGGTDQKFNILCGRDLMRENGMEPQVVLCMPLLRGTDGRKMSKSWGNHIPVLCNASDMYGKVMSLSDDMIPDYFRYCTDVSTSQLKEIEVNLRNNVVNPKLIKAELAKLIVTTYHSIEKAAEAERKFEDMFAAKKLPENIPEYTIKKEKVWLCHVMKESNMVSSTSEARRLVRQGAVAINGKKVKDIDYQIEIQGKEAFILKVGKRRFLKLVYRSR